MTSFPSGWPQPQNRPTTDGPFSKRPKIADGPSIKNPLVITLIILSVLIAIIFVASKLWTEILWFDQLESSRVLWTRWGSIGLSFVAAFVLQYSVVMACLYWAYVKRQTVVRGDNAAKVMQYQQSIAPFRKSVFWGVPAFFTLFSAVSVSANWQTFLVWFNRKPFGVRDPQFGIDTSFYVFTLPVLNVILGFLIGTLVTGIIAVVVVNYVYGAISFTPRFRTSKQARKQVGLLAAVLSVAIGVRYWLSIYSLLTSTNDLVDGALYRDVNATMPAQMILAVISLLVAILFVIAAFKGTWKLPVTGVAVMVVSAIVIGGIYPALIQQFRVTPNARQLEQPYIQRNIDATLAAYGLDEVEYQTYAAKTEATAGQLREDTDSTSQIRLLDPTVISPTVRQLQQSRPYYTFDKQLSVDRYTIDEERRDTVIAVRDIYQKGLQPEQQTWVNQATVYTHGFGVVAAYGNTVRPDGTPAFWEQSIPSEGELGDYEPRVYFSANSPEYSIVGAPEGAPFQELDYPDDNAPSGQVMTTFTGNGGPSVGNLWNKLLFAIKFASTDIFFSSQTNAESQILYDRDPLLRVAKVAPYLSLEQRAYPAIVDMDGDSSTSKRLVWIIDGYTTTNQYPYSEHMSLSDATTDSRTDQFGLAPMSETVNYMRNSVKAVVDAYDGSVELYQWDAEDPIVNAWSSVYPGMIKPMSEISGDLMAHLRYPEDLFKVQRKLLETYHVTEATEFYTGGDRWRLSEDPTGVTGDTDVTNAGLQPPYYLTMQMPTQESAEFSLTSVYVPAGAGEARRAAMAGFLAVDSETGNEPGSVRDGYGKLRLMALPSSTTVPGPGQVQNNFNTDQKVAMELNLLNQQGSNVIRGNLLTLPVGGGLLYVQPVYVQSTGTTSYPVLRYVLTAFGDQVGFAKTLVESLDETFGGDSAAQVADSADVDGVVAQEKEETQVLTYREQVSAAILKARDAMAAAQDALSKADWTAYGQEQETLDSALEELVALESVADPVPESESAKEKVDNKTKSD